ncbi:MAG: c-type cytochrome [Cypionkella sp.]
MQKPAKNRVIGLVLTCTVAVSVSAHFVVAGSGAELGPVMSSVRGVAAAEQSPIRLAQANAAQVDHPASYSSEQADRGKKIFDKECVDCHGSTLRGGMNGGPPLRGVSFEEKYANGTPASVMYVFMDTLMPPNDPGRYSASGYADLMAYILKQNGFPEGAPLPSDVDALDYLIVEK